MPYASNNDLPVGVRRHLPPHAQDIFREAFNHAWVHYSDPRQRWMGGSQEEVAQRVAWAAVKKQYRKMGEDWVRDAQSA